MIKKSFLKWSEWQTGYIKFNNNVQISYSIYSWALPINIEIASYIIFIDILCFGISFHTYKSPWSKRYKNKNKNK